MGMMISNPGAKGAKGDTGADGQSKTITVDLVIESSSMTAAQMIPGATVDGVSLTAGMILLRGFASTGSARGIYTVQASGSAVRTTGFNVSYDSLCGVLILVTRGTKFRKTLWRGVSALGGTLGSTSINFARVFGDVQQLIQPKYEIVCDGLTLLIPEFWYIDPIEGFVNIVPTDGARYFEKTLSQSSSDIYRYWYDREADQGGATATESVLEELDVTRPSGLMYQRPEIVTSCNFRADGPFEIVGERNGGVWPNQFAEGNDPDRAGYLNADAVVVDITGVKLLADGFTRGVRGSTNSFYGTELVRRLTGGNYYGFFRVRVQTDTPDNFGTGHSVYFYNGDSDLGSIDLYLEKKISSTEAIYSHSRVIGSSVDGATKIALGCFKGTSAGITVCGAQFAIDTVHIPWVRRADFPEALDLDFVLGKDVWLVDDQPMPFYPHSLVKYDRTARHDMIAQFSSEKGAAKRSFVVTGTQEIIVDPVRVGTAGRLELMPPDRDTARRRVLDLNIHVAASSGLIGSPMVHFIGDSTSNRMVPNAVDAKLQAWGLDPSYIGTINSSNVEFSTSDASGLAGEYREGRALGDYMYYTIGGDTPAVLAVGDEATYLGLSKPGKMDVNPYLREATGGDDLGIVFNGYVFDVRHYLNRFGFDDPDIVVVGLGKNDGFEKNFETSVANVALLTPVMLGQIRAALPAAKIIVWFPASPLSQYARAQWREDIRIAAELVKAVNDLDDPGIVIASTWAHVSPIGGWRIATSPAADPLTGVQYAEVADSIHPNSGAALQQTAEVLAAAIANLTS